MQSLEVKRSKLREIQAKLKNLTDTLDTNKTKKQNLEFQVIIFFKVMVLYLNNYLNYNFKQRKTAFFLINSS